MPKIPVIDSIAPIRPSTPRATVATCDGTALYPVPGSTFQCSWAGPHPGFAALSGSLPPVAADYDWSAPPGMSGWRAIAGRTETLPAADLRLVGNTFHLR